MHKRSGQKKHKNRRYTTKRKLCHTHKATIYKFKHNVRTAILRTMHRKFVSKSKNKIFNFLGYTDYELYDHLSRYFNTYCEDGRYCHHKFLIKETGIFTIDHIIPLSSCKCLQDVIALNQLHNLRLICPECNFAKSNIMPTRKELEAIAYPKEYLERVA